MTPYEARRRELIDQWLIPFRLKLRKLADEHAELTERAAITQAHPGGPEIPVGVRISSIDDPPAIVPFTPLEPIRSAGTVDRLRICGHKLPLNNCPRCWFEWLAYMNAKCRAALNKQ